MNALDDSANTDRCMLYEDSANFLKDERFTKTEYQTSANLWKMNAEDSPHELARQSEAKRKQAPQSEANVCRRRRKCNLKKPPLLIAQDTQHKLGVAFEVRERKNKNNKTLRSVHFGVVVVELINCKCGGIVRNQIW